MGECLYKTDTTSSVLELLKMHKEGNSSAIQVGKETLRGGNDEKSEVRK